MVRALWYYCDLINTHFFLQETRRNTLIKDSMRETCIPALVESWYQILQTYQRSHSELTCQCLEVVGAYVSWIDLNLIANDRSEHTQKANSHETAKVLCLFLTVLNVLYFSFCISPHYFCFVIWFFFVRLDHNVQFLFHVFETILEVTKQSNQTILYIDENIALQGNITSWVHFSYHVGAYSVQLGLNLILI